MYTLCEMMIKKLLGEGFTVEQITNYAMYYFNSVDILKALMEVLHGV